MAIISAEPQLYSVDEAGVPALYGVRDSTGHVSFPVQSFGSERTGEHGADLQTVALSGLGTVQAMATVHLHHGRDIAAPFTVASIALDEGPLIRAVLVDPETIAGGSRVRAVTFAAPADPESADVTVELRFTSLDAEEHS